MKRHEMTQEICLSAEVSGVVHKYIPAKVNDIPERCHPSEGGYAEDIKVELVAEVTGKDGKKQVKRLDITDFLENGQIEGIADELVEDAESHYG